MKTIYFINAIKCFVTLVCYTFEVISTPDLSYPVDTRRRFNVYTTSYRHRIDVETTSCVYWVGGGIIV